MTDRDSTGIVEYGPPGGELKTAFASQHGLIDANQRLHKVELRGLTPGTRYRYRVVAREISKFHPYRVTFGETITSEFREFRTLDRGRREFSFLVYNDVHDQPAFIPDLLKVAGAAPYDFVVWNGDMVNHVENEGQITALLDQARPERFHASTPWGSCMVTQCSEPCCFSSGRQSMAMISRPGKAWPMRSRARISFSRSR